VATSCDAGSRQILRTGGSGIFITFQVSGNKSWCGVQANFANWFLYSFTLKKRVY